METTPVWSLIPIATAALLSLTLLALARRNRWSDPQPEPDQIPTPEPVPSLTDGDLRSKLVFLWGNYRRELTLAGVFLVILIFASLSAPVEIQGDFSNSPGEVGSPFYFVHWMRNHMVFFYHETATASNILTGLLALGIAIFALVKKSPQKIKASVLWSFMALAGSAQWMVSGQIQSPLGVPLYLLAVAGFLIWSLVNNDELSRDIEGPHTLPRHWEVILVLLIIGLAIFGRMYQLRTHPYGIEGDEAKWTAEVVWLGLRGELDLSGLYHRDSLPVSFYMQTIFHRLMGPSLFAARFEVAFFSVIATFILYLLVRRIAAMPIALLASWLLAASIFDISASRLSNVESHVKIWPILALALFAWALHKKHWTYYSIAGVALALGLLTYDTVWPIGTAILVIAIIESIRQKDGLGVAMRNLMALLTPTLLVMPFIIPYMTGRLTYYEFGSRDWGDSTAVFWFHFQRVFTSWYEYVFEDFLYNRSGPLLNAFLLPWMTFGFVASIATLRRRLSLWTVIWLLLFVFPIPIAAHSPFGRVYYPALPAAYILTAAGMVIFSRESLRGLGRDFRPLIAAITITVLAWLPIFNLFIYFNEVIDFSDRQMRREVAEMAGEVASEDNLIVLAVVPSANEALNNEHQMIELFMMQNLPIDQIEQSYGRVALEDVLPTLKTMSNRPSRSIVLDKHSPNEREKREELTSGIQKCYPGARWLDGEYFIRVDLDPESLSNPACVSAALTLEQEKPDTFHWELSQGSANRVAMACETQQISHTRIDTEMLSPGPGWQATTAFATGWTGEGFLMDNFDSKPTLFDFQVEEAKPLYIWVRYYKRVVDTSPGFISVNGQAYPFSDIELDKVNQWVWERVGPFDAPVGLNTGAISRPYNDDPLGFMALFIDTIVTTTEPDFTPTDDSFVPLPLKTYTFPNDIAEGSVVLQLDPGVYRCTIQAFSQELPLVDPLGNSTVRSNTIDFTVEP